MIEELKTFIEVVKYKNFTKAGKIVNLSQPSVSLHIKRLEAYFNTVLIERSSKSKQVNITKQGQIVYEEGMLLIKHIESIKGAIVCSENEVSGKLKVGASQTIGEHFLPAMLKSFSVLYPNLEIEVMIENTASICERVKEKQVDIGLIEGLHANYDFECQPIYGDRMVLAVSNDSKLIESTNLMESLQDQVWVSRETGSGTQEYLKLFLETNQIKPKHMMVFSTNYAVQEAVKNGLGITLISEYVVNHAAYDKEITILKLDEQCTREFSCILSKDKEMMPATAAFIERLKEYQSGLIKTNEINKIK